MTGIAECVQVGAWMFIFWVIMGRERVVNGLRAEQAKLVDENKRMADAILGIGEEEIARDSDIIGKGLAAVAGRDVIRGWMDSYQTAIDDGAKPPLNKRARHHWLKSHFLGVYRKSAKFWAATDVDNGD